VEQQAVKSKKPTHETRWLFAFGDLKKSRNDPDKY
jgi:hypothetical protein